MAKYVTDNQPDTAKELKNVYNDDLEKWGKEMKPKWEAAQEAK